MSGALGGCGGEKNSPDQSSNDTAKGNRDATAEVLHPEASGEVTYGTDQIAIDASHASDGYVMLNYTGTNEKVKFQIETPEGEAYTYLVTKNGTYIVYPLTQGSGTYQLTLYEAASVEENLYATAFTQNIDVTITDEFVPFLAPNCYVDFDENSKAVKKGEELAAGCGSDLDVVTNIYHYVIENITYDEEKAENVAYGYVPDVDETLSSGKGICFDYAALMAAMLRSQRIPTKLQVGYAGEAYHAWISCYVDEIGWVDNMISFDGKDWSLMDPTLAANNDDDTVKDYIGDGSRYIIKYTY